MPLELKFPTTEAQILLWTQIVFFWMLINYSIPGVPVTQAAIRAFKSEDRKRVCRGIASKGAAFALLSLFLPGLSLEQFWPKLLLAIVIFLLTLGFPATRILLHKKVGPRTKGLTAEFELLWHLLFVVATGYLIALISLQVPPNSSLITIPFSSKQVSTLFIIGASIVFLTTGGTLVVRGILDKTGSLPRKHTAGGVLDLKLHAHELSTRTSELYLLTQESSTDAEELRVRAAEISSRVDEFDKRVQQLGVQSTEQQSPTDSSSTTSTVDTKELNLGEYIGILERFIILIVTLVGAYEAIGFILAGKGLIRAREFEDRDFAEYFLVGTLISTLTAVLVGIVIKHILQHV
jgi:hypothetical protein